MKELTFDDEGSDADADAEANTEADADAEFSAVGKVSSALKPSELVFPTANPESYKNSNLSCLLTTMRITKWSKGFGKL